MRAREAEAAGSEGAASAIEFEGVVGAGLGEGARFTAIDWVGAALRRATGFDPWPGTLNLRLDEAAQRAWQRAQRIHAGIAIDPAPGFCPARCHLLWLAGRVRAAAVVPEVDGYPADKLEIVAPVALREALGLQDGDRLRVRVDRSSPPPATTA
ncbi:MAG: CTP-dependent riboflavin kinase [Burkholderiales bacterium]|nr:CTP-dependent riboflavin kinase [Burkholderiales bacterium]